jgi:hypothetical protein
MTDRDTTTRTRARAPGVGGVFHRMAVHDRVLRPDSERTTVATTKCTKGGCKLDGGRRMPGAGLSRRSPRKAPLGQSAFQPYWGKLAVRNDRGDRGNVGIIRSPIRASILPDQSRSHQRGVCPLCAPMANRDGPDCASAPNSKPSNGERSDPNNSKSPSRNRESRASRAQCGSSTSVVRLRPLVPTARYALVARRTSLRPPR